MIGLAHLKLKLLMMISYVLLDLSCSSETFVIFIDDRWPPKRRSRDKVYTFALSLEVTPGTVVFLAVPEVDM